MHVLDMRNDKVILDHWNKCVISPQEAVTALNTLQSNAQTLEKIRQQRGKKSEHNVPNMIKFAERVGITVSSD